MRKPRGWFWIKRVIKMHRSRVITLPALACRWFDIQRGDFLVVEVDVKQKKLTVYKWHEGVGRAFPSYGYKDVRAQMRRTSPEDTA